MPQKLTAVVLAIAALLACSSAFAQQSGETVTVLIPTDQNQPDPPSGPQDKLIFTGGRVTTIDTTGCALGSHPVQNAILIDPAGGQPGRITGVIVISHSDPISPGTKLTNLVEQPPCTIGLITYRRYQGTVE
jgi:hypothetical protein